MLHVFRFLLKALVLPILSAVETQSWVDGVSCVSMSLVDFDDQSPSDAAHCRQVRSVMHLISSA